MMRWTFFVVSVLFFLTFAVWCLKPVKPFMNPPLATMPARDLNENPERNDEEQLDLMEGWIHQLALWILSWFEVGMIEPDVDRLLWEETGVPFPEGMKFYKLPRVSQHLSIVNSTHVNTPTPAGNEPVHRKPIWTEPGGLHWSPRSEWRNATAALFPGDITVYRTMTQVTNSAGFKQDNAVVRWAFPDGTMFADLQIRTHEGREWPFELRVREKHDGKWSAKVYRPWSEPPTGSVYSGWTVPRLDPKIDPKVIEVYKVPKGIKAGKFVESRLTFVSDHDGGFFPPYYSGNAASCTACHDRAGESEGYAGSNAPGSDTVISWHPFANVRGGYAEPEFDGRWPLKIEHRFVGRDVDHFGRRIPGLR